MGRLNLRGKKGHIWKLLFNGEKYGECRWCGRQLLFEQATVDHVLPRSYSGKNDIENLVISCGNCNCYRGTSSDIVLRSNDIAKYVCDCHSDPFRKRNKWGRQLLTDVPELPPESLFSYFREKFIETVLEKKKQRDYNKWQFMNIWVSIFKEWEEKFIKKGEV